MPLWSRHKKKTPDKAKRRQSAPPGAGARSAGSGSDDGSDEQQQLSQSGEVNLLVPGVVPKLGNVSPNGSVRIKAKMFEERAEELAQDANRAVSPVASPRTKGRRRERPASATMAAVGGRKKESKGRGQLDLLQPDTATPSSSGSGTQRRQRLGARGRQASLRMQQQLLEGTTLEDLLAMHEFLSNRLSENATATVRAMSTKGGELGKKPGKSSGAGEERLHAELSAVEDKIRAAGGTVPSWKKSFTSSPTTKRSPAMAVTYGRRTAATTGRAGVSDLFAGGAPDSSPGSERKSVSAVFGGAGGDERPLLSPVSAETKTGTVRQRLKRSPSMGKKEDLQKTLTSLQLVMKDLSDDAVTRGPERDALADMLASAARPTDTVDGDKKVEKLLAAVHAADEERSAVERTLEAERAKVERANANVERLMGAIGEYQETMEAEKEELVEKLEEALAENDTLREEMDALRKRMNAKVMELHQNNVEAIELMAGELEMVEEMNQNLEEQLEMEKEKRRRLTRQLDMQQKLADLVEQQHEMDRKMEQAFGSETDTDDASSDDDDGLAGISDPSTAPSIRVDVTGEDTGKPAGDVDGEDSTDDRGNSPADGKSTTPPGESVAAVELGSTGLEARREGSPGKGDGAPCASCRQTLERNSFSAAQWKKKSKRRCKPCVAQAAAEGRQLSSDNLNAPSPGTVRSAPGTASGPAAGTTASPKLPSGGPPKRRSSKNVISPAAPMSLDDF